jgi:hypothetical protein
MLLSLNVCAVFIVMWARAPTRPHSKAFTADNKTALFAFATKAFEAVQLSLGPQLLNDGLFRVDIMVRSDGEMVVNEFESLEGTYSTDNAIANETLRVKLISYWKNVLENLFTYG